jgi:hypothetical protein
MGMMKSVIYAVQGVTAIMRLRAVLPCLDFLGLVALVFEASLHIRGQEFELIRGYAGGRLRF